MPEAMQQRIDREPESLRSPIDDAGRSKRSRVQIAIEDHIARLSIDEMDEFAGTLASQKPKHAKVLSECLAEAVRLNCGEQE